MAELQKNRVVLGLMTFGPNKAWGAKTTSLDEYGRFLDYFQSMGYDEVDTACMYQHGEQEGFTAQVGWKKRNLKLATKLYPVKGGMHSPKSLREAVETSLRELQTDSIDTFYLHAADRSTPFAESLQEVNDMYKEGKFRQFGISNFTSFEVAEVVLTCHANGWVRPTVYQAMYNAFTRGMEAELVPALRRYGIDILVYNGLAGGLFTGKYNAKNTEAPKDLTHVDKTYRARYLRDASLEALSLVEPIVQKHGLTLVETAIRWLVHHSALKMRSKGGNDGILTGASSLEQFKSTLPLFDKGPLPEEVVKALNDEWQISKAQAPDYWHLDLEYTYDTTKVLFG
ncbi:aflatoxin B1-aldehyde reductase [Mytilinidion resinicola]|uniref:Aflatoxin B1-aldehyde reductase n=1 Tax=Mytilinidion resinicola TaxID=574789 RepID=A0A6A6Y3F2_9PEZI|nr:aflatoxin B1-aldehyde reductase [Mytilinidion resinicola]KAF2803048.1 aflatoxin B1-aldehyde reductase [Mytilinidion resinicola]